MLFHKEGGNLSVTEVAKKRPPFFFRKASVQIAKNKQSFIGETEIQFETQKDLFGERHALRIGADMIQLQKRSDIIDFIKAQFGIRERKELAEILLHSAVQVKGLCREVVGGDQR